MSRARGNRLIGITGGIASGKSRVARYLAHLSGWPLIDCDAIAARLNQPGQAGWERLRHILPPEFFAGDGSLRRAEVRTLILTDTATRRRVNEALHPLIQREVIQEGTAGSPGPRLVEVPLLFEAGWQALFSSVVAVYASPGVSQTRLVARDGVSPDSAVAAAAAHLPGCDKALMAHHVINNTGEWWATMLQVRHLWRVLASESPSRMDSHQG